MGAIKQVLEEKVPLSITPAVATSIVRFVNAYESRDTHPEAFNSPYLGLQPCYFLTSDRDDFFILLSTGKDEFYKLIQGHSSKDTTFGVKTGDLNKMSKKEMDEYKKASQLQGIDASAMRKIISELSSVDSNFKVASDPLNIFITYVLYKVYQSNLTVKLKEETMFKLIMFLQYKFFTSLVNHRFKYKPDESAMVAMYESLSNKFDLKQLGTWKKVMETRAHQFISRSSIHMETFEKYEDDKKILYLITDVQTRIRNQINIITQEFMKVKETYDRIGSYSHIGSDIDGEKSLIAADGGMDTAITNIYNDAVSVPRWVDDSYIEIIHGMFPSVNSNTFRALLISFSEYAVKLTKSGDGRKEKTVGDRTKFIGPQVLIYEIVQKSYRYCSQNGVGPGQRLQVIKTVKDVFSSSRISDRGIVDIRDSVHDLVLEIQSSRRESTVTSLRSSFILYVILMTFKYVK